MDASAFLADLERSPDALAAFADAVERGDVVWPVTPPPARVLLMGMGSSLYAAQVAALRLRGHGINAVAESGAAEATWPGAPDDLVVGISAGGGSVETNRLFAECSGARRVALTNTDGSAITASADAVVHLRAERESGGVACRSFVHTIAALLVLEQQLTGIDLHLPQRFRAAVDAAHHLLDTRGEWLPEAARLLAGPHGTWVLAPAERLSSAMQGALMFREGPRRAAVGTETGDWSHVEVYLTTTLDYRALVFSGSRWDAPAADWLTQRASTVVAVGEFPGAALSIHHPGSDDPIVRLLAETLVPDLVAAHLWAAG
jgi:fructoselysine-6-P-deglycase FrlB-like protein